MNTTKLSSTAAKLETFFKVIQKVTGAAIIVLVAVLAVMTIANAVNPDVVIGTGVTQWSIGNLSFELAEEYHPDNANVLRFLWVISIIIIACAAMVYAAFGYIRKILKFMADGEPFRMEISGYLKKLAYLSLGLGVMQNIEMIVGTACSRAFPLLDTLVESGMVRSITTHCTLELSFVVVFFVLLLMSYIFSYGAQLQQLSDETL